MMNLLNVFFGALRVIGFWLFESLIFGALLWAVLTFLLFPYINIFMHNAGYDLLPQMHYFVAVGFMLLLKLLKFDSAKIGRVDNEE